MRRQLGLLGVSADTTGVSVRLWGLLLVVDLRDIS